ncbi:MAG TPA: class I SAM-dependent methyltransferase [Candidatus Levybacteria bacterium]|nr:class I SAM-dependent methyltransferase [Candidatus Levybacteria bacterium]
MHKYINVGIHTYFLTCRFCNSHKVRQVLNLGYVPLAGGFFKENTPQKVLENEKLYPLQLNFCESCYLLQCNVSIPPETLFKDYFYYSSTIKTLVEHFNRTAKGVKKYLDQKKAFIIEIGCNDGTFLDALANEGYTVLGVDPAENITIPLIKKGKPILNTFFTENVGSKIAKDYGRADAIYSFHSMAHIEDMHSVMRGIKKVLKKNGYLAFEVHYLGKLIQEMQYDMIYHEHQFYYSLLSLKKFFGIYDMEIFDVSQTPLRGGSIMYYVQNKKSGKRKINKSVKLLETAEKKQGLTKMKTYTSFAKRIEKTKKSLLKTIDTLRKDNKNIIGYGASGRGTVIMNYCNLTADSVKLVVDDSPMKQNSYMPGTHQKIYSSKKLLENPKSTYAVLFAWPFVNEVLLRNSEYIKRGGQFIVPLPSVKILPK